MFTFSNNFPFAAKDYAVFLAKNYPKQNILKLVGDRYKLTGIERAMLYRGITTPMKSNLRMGKLAGEKELKNIIIHIDTYNQLVTIGSYLHGRVVFISNDGYLRDASELHGNANEAVLPMRSAELVMAFLVKMGIAGAVFYIDSQVNENESFCKSLEKLLIDFRLETEIIVSENVDKELIHKTEGLICSSDSTIIDRAGLNIFDLARATLEYHFWPKFFDLKIFSTDSQI
jgi:hypothetical protein